MSTVTPALAWQNLKSGNARFVDGTPAHPSQGVADRARLRDGQHPRAVLFGCADSRVAAEIIFDQGLGDMFVVRTAGHVIDSAVLGSIEYATEVLEVPLIVILGHDSCGAVDATLRAYNEGTVPDGYVREVVERVTPSIMLGRREGLTRTDEFEARHVQETATVLFQRSKLISARVTEGKVAIVALTYKLSDGRAVLRGSLGDIGETHESLNDIEVSLGDVARGPEPTAV